MTDSAGLRRLIRALAMLCVVAIAILSTVPGSLRPHTGASGNIEHFIAYAGTVTLLLLGFARLPAWVPVAALSAASAMLEVVQIWIPGRGAGVDNWAASTAGAAAGAIVGLALRYVLVRLYRPRARKP